ncbi:S24 family peptidase [Necropsobacter rosorum]|uniref:XRE family transcriptional regulator n=1 Tax=Necropsobacter rosorum TaxID=908285 RepID=UPI00050998CE
MSKAKVYDQEFAKRMQFLLNTKFDGNYSKFSRAVGVQQPSLVKWIKGESDPTRTSLFRISEASGVSAGWLISGQGDPEPVNITQDISGVTMIDSFSSINVSAGYGSFNEGVTQPDGQVPYSDELLHKLSVKPRHGAVFWADGVSMRPTIDDGDQMLVDLSKKEIKGDKIYLVQNGASVWVKRLKINWDGLELISDNKDEYPPIRLTQAEAEDLQVIGQVVHIGKNLT